MTILWRFVDVDTELRAGWLVGSVALWAGGDDTHADWDGTVVALSSEALELMAALPEDNDGHFDGTHVRIGGTPYLMDYEVPSKGVVES